MRVILKRHNVDNISDTVTLVGSKCNRVGRNTRLTVFSFSLREILIFVDIATFLAFLGAVFCKNMTKIIPCHNQKVFLTIYSAYTILH